MSTLICALIGYMGVYSAGRQEKCRRAVNGQPRISVSGMVLRGVLVRRWRLTLSAGRQRQIILRAAFVGPRPLVEGLSERDGTRVGWISQVRIPRFRQLPNDSVPAAENKIPVPQYSISRHASPAHQHTSNSEHTTEEK